MKIIETQNELPGEVDLKLVSETLREGGVIMHATETCYGLAVDIFQEQALRRLYDLKKMSLQKPVSMMVSFLQEAQKYAEFNDVALRLAEKFWPGPLALVLPRKKSLPDFFNEGHVTVGIRCPDSKISQQMLKSFGGPLSTTSANISGIKEVYAVGDYLAQLQDADLKPDLIIDGGTISQNPPSTIVGFDEQGEAIFIRKGSLEGEVRDTLGGKSL